MLPKIHIILGGIFSIIIYFIFHITFFETAIIFLSSFLIDFDHYLYYIYMKKSIKLVKSYHWFTQRRKKWISLSIKEREQYRKPIFIFHGIEFWTILIVLYLFIPFFGFVIIGVFIHILLDFIELIYLNIPIYTKLSQLETFIKNKNKKYFYS